MKSWMDYLAEVMDFSESPKRYFWWSGLAAVSAVVRKQVFVDRFSYKLYPNIYVMLVSKRSGLRKGIPISLVKSLIERVGNTRIISDQNSIQGIIKELSSQKTLENGQVLHDAQGIIISDEFITLLLKSTDPLDTLTALHNTHEHEKDWSKTLRNSAVEVLKSPCISMLTATNEAMFDDFITGKDIEGGFIARTFIIHESTRNRINALIHRPDKIVDKDELAKDLKEMAKANGEYKWTKEAGDLYIDWYTRLCNSEYEDKTGSFDRLGDQVIKVALLISVSKLRGDNMINYADLEEAVEKSEECFSGLRKVSVPSGKTEESATTAKILKEFINSPNRKIYRQDVLRKHWPHIDSLTLDRTLESLMQAGALHQPKRGGKDNKDIVYEMKEEVYIQYMKFKKGEN